MFSEFRAVFINNSLPFNFNVAFKWLQSLCNGLFDSGLPEFKLLNNVDIIEFVIFLFFFFFVNIGRRTLIGLNMIIIYIGRFNFFSVAAREIFGLRRLVGLCCMVKVILIYICWFHCSGRSGVIESRDRCVHFWFSSEDAFGVLKYAVNDLIHLGLNGSAVDGIHFWRHDCNQPFPPLRKVGWDPLPHNRTVDFSLWIQLTLAVLNGLLAIHIDLFLAWVDNIFFELVVAWLNNWLLDFVVVVIGRRPSRGARWFKSTIERVNDLIGVGLSILFQGFRVRVSILL